MTDYIRRNPRVINGQWIEAFIKKGEQQDRENKVFESFCSLYIKYKDIKKATKETKRRFAKIPILVSEEQPHLNFKKTVIKVVVG